MILEVTHHTTYRYFQSVGFLPHRLMLAPRSGPKIRTLDLQIDCSPTASIEWSQDIFGNAVATATFKKGALELTITSRAVVENTASEWPVFNINPSVHTFPFSYSSEDRADLGELAMASSTLDHVGAWAREFVHRPFTDTLSLLRDINIGMLAKVGYRVREEEGTQSPEQTLAIASGSCRDIASLFIEAARSLGFGARAVSGYVYDRAAIAGAGGSTHAWAEVYLPDAGWIAFDPTHRRVGEAFLIPVAIARYNGQIMPVIGGYVGTKNDFVGMDVSVAVTER